MLKNDPSYSDRQQREIEYHREFANRCKSDHWTTVYDLIEAPVRRWWNASWEMYTLLLNQNLVGTRALVVGCGFGEDARRLTKLGSRVWAFDLSPEMLAGAREAATQEGLDIDFRQMPAEKLAYRDDFFDIVLAQDILHHVEIPAAMRELSRVAKPGAFFCMNEVYSHSLANCVRNSTLVKQFLYPHFARIIYKGKPPYITTDERKLTQADIRQITRGLTHTETRYFYFLINRFIANDNIRVCKIDRLILRALGPISSWLGGRAILTGQFKKNSD